MDNEGNNNRITLSELSELTKYNTKQIIKWLNDGLLLPKLEGKEYLGRGKGNITYYPEENLRRLNVFRWYEDCFNKQPGKVGGLDFLFHLLFIFGFKSEKIFLAERRVINESCELLKEAMKSDKYDAASVLLDLHKIINHENLLLPAITFICSLVNKKSDPDLVDIFSKSFSRSALDVNTPFIFELPDLIDLVPKLNDKALQRVQNGICFMISSAAGLPNYDIMRETYNFHEKLEFSDAALIKITNNLLQRLTEKALGGIPMLSFFVNPKNSVLIYLIFIGLRDSEDTIEKLHPIFTEEELEKIPKVPGIGVSKGKLINV